MSDTQPQNNQPPILSTQDEIAKTNAIIAYVLMLAGIFTGVLWIVGGIWAMVKKSEASGSIFEDHYDNIITVFGWGLGLAIIGVLSAIIVVGYFILLGVFIWSLYRVIKGLSRVTSNQSFQ